MMDYSKKFYRRQDEETIHRLAPGGKMSHDESCRCEACLLEREARDHYVPCGECVKKADELAILNNEYNRYIKSSDEILNNAGDKLQALQVQNNGLRLDCKSMAKKIEGFEAMVQTVSQKNDEIERLRKELKIADGFHRDAVLERDRLRAELQSFTIPPKYKEAK